VVKPPSGFLLGHREVVQEDAASSKSNEAAMDTQEKKKNLTPVQTSSQRIYQKLDAGEGSSALRQFRGSVQVQAEGL
jgi:hypothetical protein